MRTGTGGLLQRLEATQSKLELERRLHGERIDVLTREAGALRTGAQAIAGDCRSVHGALMRLLRENGELRSQLSAERVITSSMSRRCASDPVHAGFDVCARWVPQLQAL